MVKKLKNKNINEYVVTPINEIKWKKISKINIFVE